MEFTYILITMKGSKLWVIFLGNAVIVNDWNTCNCITEENIANLLCICSIYFQNTCRFSIYSCTMIVKIYFPIQRKVECVILHI